MINALDILEKYSDDNTHVPRYLLEDGGQVIGMEADDLNQMIYIIKHNNEITLASGKDLRISQDLIKSKPQIVEHSANS